MKKILVLVVICLCMCGCGKKEENFSFSEVKVKKNILYGSNIYGSIKNNTAQKCKSLHITFTAKNGDIKEKCWFEIDEIDSNKTLSFDELVISCPENLDGYIVSDLKVERVECE